ncbi:MAG TPA: hypothetical protein VFG20_19225 [Planctomycetaceae bacterium]|nr:hypothetical protein [Planctomycetaceae bacterium]
MPGIFLNARHLPFKVMTIASIEMQKPGVEENAGLQHQRFSPSNPSRILG